MADTDSDGIGDADEDVDGDSLKAIKEQTAGTSPIAADTDSDGLIERRWLGMRESVIRVEQTQAGWDMASPSRGPGRAAQEVLACVVPGAIVGWLVLRGLGRRSVSKRSHLGRDRVETNR